MAKLIRKYNITLLEYKPVSYYSEVPKPIVMTVLGKRSKRKPSAHSRYRLSRDPPRPLAGKELLWHIKTGHLGKKAIQRLVQSAQNIKITGLSRTNCEIYATIYAKRNILRQISENRAPRPFWHIH